MNKDVIYDINNTSFMISINTSFMIFYARRVAPHQAENGSKVFVIRDVGLYFSISWLHFKVKVFGAYFGELFGSMCTVRNAIG